MGAKVGVLPPVSLQLLLVDPDARALAQARRLARAQGHAVTTRETAKGLVEEVRHTRYHVALVDQRFLEEDGLTLFRRVREADSDLSIVLFAAKPELATAVATMKLGAADYLLKPLTAPLLRDCLFDVARAKSLFRDPGRRAPRPHRRQRAAPARAPRPDADPARAPDGAVDQPPLAGRTGDDLALALDAAPARVFARRARAGAARRLLTRRRAAPRTRLLGETVGPLQSPKMSTRRCVASADSGSLGLPSSPRPVMLAIGFASR